jgi:hypothetical protein
MAVVKAQDKAMRYSVQTKQTRTHATTVSVKLRQKVTISSFHKGYGDFFKKKKQRLR